MNESRQIHVRFDGRSVDLHLRDLDVGQFSSDDQIKLAIAEHLGVPISKFRHYTIDRHSNGNLTVRPEAVFG